MLVLHIEAENIADLRSQMAKVLRGADPVIVEGPAPLPDTIPALQEIVASASAAVTLPSAPEKQSRRGRPPKNKAAGDVAVESADPKAAPAVTDPAPVATDPTPTPAAPSAEAPTGPKVEAAPTDTAAVVTPDPSPVEAAASSSPTHSIDDCRVALQAVNERHGLPGCMALLKEFGVDRVSLVAPEKFSGFIAACQAKAAA